MNEEAQYYQGPARYQVNFSVAQNEDEVQTFLLTDTAGNPIVIADAKMKINRYDLTGTMLDLNLSNGYLSINAENPGYLTVSIPESIMRTFTAAIYVHDLVITTDNGRKIQVWHGRFTVRQGYA